MINYNDLSKYTSHSIDNHGPRAGQGGWNLCGAFLETFDFEFMFIIFNGIGISFISRICKTEIKIYRDLTLFLGDWLEPEFLRCNSSKWLWNCIKINFPLERRKEKSWKQAKCKFRVLMRGTWIINRYIVCFTAGQNKERRILHV